MRKLGWFVLVMVGLFGCNDPNAPDFIKSAGHTATEQRPGPGPIRSITMRDDIALELVQGLTSAELTGPKNELPKIKLTYADGRLTVENDNGFQWVRAYRGIRLRLPADSVTEVIQEGFGSITCLDTLRGPKIHLALYGATTAQFNVVTQDLALDGNGPGELTVAGRTRYAYIALRKYASLQGAGLIVHLADVYQDGAGSATFLATDSVHLSQRGPGCLRLLGPAKVSIDPANPSACVTHP